VPVSSNEMDIRDLCITRGALHFPVGRSLFCPRMFLVYTPRRNGSKSSEVEITMKFPENSC
jgi:hypothetical protein